MPGAPYTKEEIAAMDGEEFAAARSRGFHRPEGVPAPETAADVSPKDPNAWRTRKRQGKDFTCPSGQRCRLRPLDPEKMLEAGLLDQITRLEGLADALVQKAEGAPPQRAKMPSREDFRMLLEVLNALVPLAVEEPTVYADGDTDAPEDAIFASDIDLEDRMAIMDESLKGIRTLDRFRHP